MSYDNGRPAAFTEQKELPATCCGYVSANLVTADSSVCFYLVYY